MWPTLGFSGPPQRTVMYATASGWRRVVVVVVACLAIMGLARERRSSKELHLCRVIYSSSSVAHHNQQQQRDEEEVGMFVKSKVNIKLSINLNN